MKLTAQRIGLPITGRLNSAFDPVVFYRGLMRGQALNWRKWRDTQCRDYKTEALRSARNFRDLANYHTQKLTR